ncbi:S16 family serine protease [Motilimonas pumila]|uniref:endopeptidase La n=1 Tax=Motilimonas pumila TaxID=2303987 RepID=A0A418YBI9_9GAMM|nr:S16 family serine protease [Motilimonas pumila]RJG41864.1 hypothetical protein D1Z90_15950 [Motilimonas pumila]
MTLITGLDHLHTTNTLTLEQLQPCFTSALTTCATQRAPWPSLFPFAQQEVQAFAKLSQPLLTLVSSDWLTSQLFLQHTLADFKPHTAPLYLLDQTAGQAGYFHSELTVEPGRYRKQSKAVQDTINDHLGDHEDGDIHAVAAKRIGFLESASRAQLFGEVYNGADGTLQLKPGALACHLGGILVVQLPALLEDPTLWQDLKRCIESQTISWHDAVCLQPPKSPLPQGRFAAAIKVILVGSREQLAELHHLDPDAAQNASMFTELASEVRANESNMPAIQDFICQIAAPFSVSLDLPFLNALLQHLSQLREHREYIKFNGKYLQRLLGRLCLDETPLTPEKLQQVLRQIRAAMTLPQKYSDESIAEQQIPISLTGNAIGQVNGLSVVELDGHPLEFGEVFRVTAAEYLGDGEVIDVERKADMAGNIHSKSMMIVESYLSQVFAKKHHIPFSANVVFEQSYSHSEGDSASIATYVAVISALSQCPVKQTVAITGAMDQQGHVLAVGGINDKIMALYRTTQVCQLEHKVSVLIPHANLINLNLDSDILAGVAEGKIDIISIGHVSEALDLALTEHQGWQDVYARIKQRFKSLQDDDDETLGSHWDWLTKWFR